MRTTTLLSGAPLALLLLPLGVVHAGSKVDVCHYTGSSTNPYEVISVSTKAAVAHLNHGDVLAGAWYADLDGDGYGDADGVAELCPADESDVSDSSDCDDSDASVNPGEIEVEYDGVDNDCDASSADDDLDGDGYGYIDDCDDDNDTINPGVDETAYDGIDNDCDVATPDDDLDGDGYLVADDCDDGDAYVNPSMTEIPYDDIDNDCDPATPDNDVDGDGYDLVDDCDDTNGSVNPLATEACNDGIDNDCDTDIDEECTTATTYDFAQDFTGANPSANGVWGYGRLSTLGGAQAHSLTGGTTGSLMYRNSGGFYANQIYKNLGTATYGNCADWCLQPEQTALHPENANNYMSARFTAPAAGDYLVSALFTPVDRQSNEILAYVHGPSGTLAAGTLTTYGTTVSYTGTVSLAAGQTIDFAVNRGASWANDGTLLNATVEGPY